MMDIITTNRPVKSPQTDLFNHHKQTCQITTKQTCHIIINGRQIAKLALLLVKKHSVLAMHYGMTAFVIVMHLNEPFYSLPRYLLTCEAVETLRTCKAGEPVFPVIRQSHELVRRTVHWYVEVLRLLAVIDDAGDKLETSCY